MKKVISILAALSLCCTPVFAANSSVPEKMPATWLDPIQHPEASSVVSFYQYNKIGNYLSHTNEPSAIKEVCQILDGMKASEVVLNVTDVSFVPVNRTPGETIFELRTGQGNGMRYYLQNDGDIISQRIENGMMYQGMRFTGGNVGDTVKKMLALPTGTDSGTQILELPLDFKELYLYNYYDMTCTRIKNQAVLDEIALLFKEIITPESFTTDSNVLGASMRDIQDLQLMLEDGTVFTVSLFEDGVQVLETTDSINVPRPAFYKMESNAYQQLQSLLRTYQSACMPLWLYNMPQDRISSITLTSVVDGRTATLQPGDAYYNMLLEMSTGIVVEPLNFKNQVRRSYPDTGYEIKFSLNDDRICTVDYTDSLVEVSHTGQDYVAGYRPSKGAPFLPEDFGTLLDVLLD